MKAWLWCSAALAVGFTACGVRDVLRSERVVESSPAYRAALDGATRSGETVRVLTSPARVHATLYTPAFREALADEQRRVYGPNHTDDELAPPYLTLLLALTSSERELARPDAYGELWSLGFAAAGTDAVETAPRTVAAHDRKDTFYRYFFPYWTPWREMYRVEFPLEPDVDAGTLYFRGVGGEIELTW